MSPGLLQRQAALAVFQHCSSQRWLRWPITGPINSAADALRTREQARSPPAGAAHQTHSHQDRSRTMTTITHPPEPTYTHGKEHRAAGHWADISVDALVEQCAGESAPLVELNHSRGGERWGRCAGPLSCEQALELARALIAAVNEAQAVCQRAEAVAR